MTDREYENSLTAQILAFSRQFVCEPEETSSELVAKHRHWLDDSGHPTREGEELVEELKNQQGTRSIYRLVF